jgi:hypothetical protein
MDYSSQRAYSRNLAQTSNSHIANSYLPNYFEPSIFMNRLRNFHSQSIFTTTNSNPLMNYDKFNIQHYSYANHGKAKKLIYQKFQNLKLKALILKSKPTLAAMPSKINYKMDFMSKRSRPLNLRLPKINKNNRRNNKLSESFESCGYNLYVSPLHQNRTSAIE